jgi:putative acyl-CoA dehydrogenase
MTFAVVPSIRLQPELAAEWEPHILSDDYDPRFIPAPQKHGVLFGMALTERQGGSDVQTNTTRAVPLGKRGGGEEYELTGHKWFCSAPMCDAFLTLAQTDRGLSCFLLPRLLSDGTRNGFQLQRLKDKLGNRSNASSEVEFHKARARLVGEEGRGVLTIIEMVRHTRLDCAFGSAATMRRALAEALHHAAFRQAFGKKLLDQPLMRNVLADLCLETEAATALALRLARGFDESPHDESQRRFTRLATAVGKYWITKRAVAVVAEALECLGGNGYVEESPLPRLYRDAPVNSIWEGSGNVQCLEMLRAVRKDAGTLDVVLHEIRAARGGNKHFDSFRPRLERELADSTQLETRARRLTELLALALQASLLVQHAPTEVADAFCAARLAGDAGLAFGTLPADTDFEVIIERARPNLQS